MKNSAKDDRQVLVATEETNMKLHPSYLWIGPEAELKERATLFIKDALCKANHLSLISPALNSPIALPVRPSLQEGESKRGESREDSAKGDIPRQTMSLRQAACDRCASCVNVNNKRHHLVTWLTPENYYTLAQLEGVAQTLTFALSPDEHYFIVFEQAQLFNIACANSLLKSLEEPPPGYHFILLAARAEGILPTIRSRCMVEHFQSTAGETLHPLFQYFTPVDTFQAAEFVREFERLKMTERDIYIFLDELTAFWFDQLRAGYKNNDAPAVRQSQKILDALQAAQSLPVMPGSSKLFLKNLYLTLSLIH